MRTLKWTNSIAFRLSASIALVIVATSLTVATLILNDETKTLENRLHIRALQLGEIMSRQMVEPLLYEERYAIYALFDSYIKSNDSIIVYAEVYDDQGQFLLNHKVNSRIEQLTEKLSPFSKEAGFIGQTNSFNTGEVFDLVQPIKTTQLGLIGYLRMGITPLHVLDSLTNIKNKVLKLTTVIVFFGILAGLWIARKILNPILVLNRALLQIEKENLGTEIEPLGIGEICELTISFNKMSQKLKNSMASMKAVQDSLVRKEKLYVLGEFSASLAHEIKNPLTPVKMLIQRAHEQQEPLEGEDLVVINDELKRIDKIVSQFLGYARMTEPHSEKIDINMLIEDVLALVKHKIEKTGIKHSFLSSSTPLVVNINPDSFKQVIINLILNAVQAMSNGGVLKLATYNYENNVKIEVSDSGTGMTAEQLEKKFDPFFTTKQNGTGLGLSIVWNIIESHHGTIEFTSEPQQGTTAIVSLPYA
ncbi:MAG: hypothetical protein DRH37_03820 [Deltaproteobacteria bacterium]|nr:MAG: hypothetical protein DRH37_03820 [Deltaproteobacteria bacterium]